MTQKTYVTEVNDAAQCLTTKCRCISCVKALRGGQSLTLSMAGTRATLPQLSGRSTQKPCLKLQRHRGGNRVLTV
jgi:hypothetical protein